MLPEGITVIWGSHGYLGVLLLQGAPLSPGKSYCCLGAALLPEYPIVS